MMFVCGIKASLTSSRCAARRVIVFKTILLVVSDVVAVSLGIWLASVPPFNRLLLPLPLIPFLLFLHATDSVSVSGADPSMSADEKENWISLTFPPMSLVPVQRVLSLVPTSVLVSTSRRLATSTSPPPSSRVTLESSAESSVDLQDNELDELQSQSDSPSPSRSPFLLLQSPILHLQSLLLQSPLFPASFMSVPASEKPVPVTAKSSGCLSTNWGVSRRSGSGYVVFECPNSQVVWDFGSLSRSIEEVDSISFEYTIVS